MRRAAHGAILGFLALLGAVPARADCASELRVARQKLPTVRDEVHSKELTRLLDKAAKNVEAGRKRLRTDAMMHAQTPLD